MFRPKMAIIKCLKLYCFKETALSVIIIIITTTIHETNFKHFMMAF
jgi:hypothetical protein